MDPRVEYALNVLLGTDPAATVPVTYGPLSARGKSPGIHVVASGFFDDVYGTPASAPRLPLPTLDGVPLLFGQPRIECHDNQVTVYADILAATFFLVTRYEEWIRRDVRDEHGRFPGRESLPYRAGFIDRPIVDEYAALLRGWAPRAGLELPGPSRRFSVLLTHDVDTLGVRRSAWQSVRSIGGGLLGRHGWRHASGRAAASLGLVRDPFDNLDRVMRINQRLTQRVSKESCRTVFFFMAGGAAPQDRAYGIRDGKVRRALRQVLQAGATVGLHASYEAGMHPERLAAERAALEAAAGTPIRGNRHHYLAWREPEDGRQLAAAGITWDSTLGYADVAGFRLGVCRPIPLFDPAAQRPMGIEEHPLIVMDRSLEMTKYMGLDAAAALDYVSRLVDVTERHRGELVLLWHNQVLSTVDRGYHRPLYGRILDYVATKLPADLPARVGESRQVTRAPRKPAPRLLCG